jgi:hypothetical protein
MIAYALDQGVYIGTDVRRDDVVVPPPGAYNPWLSTAYDEYAAAFDRARNADAAGQQPDPGDLDIIRRGDAAYGKQYDAAHQPNLTYVRYVKSCRYLFPSGIYSDFAGEGTTAEEAEAAAFCPLFLHKR